MQAVSHMPTITEDEKESLAGLNAIIETGKPSGCGNRVLEGLLAREYIVTEDEETFTVTEGGLEFRIDLIRRAVLVYPYRIPNSARTWYAVARGDGPGDIIAKGFGSLARANHRAQRERVLLSEPVVVARLADLERKKKTERARLRRIQKAINAGGSRSIHD